MTIKPMWCGLFLLVATINLPILCAKNLTDFEVYSELKKYVETCEENPSDIKDSDIKKTIPLAMKAAQSNNTALKLFGLLALKECIQLDNAFDQFPQVLELVRKAVKNTDVQVRCVGLAVLEIVVGRYTKIDEIKEEALRITHTAIKSRNEQEQLGGFDLYTALVNRDKTFNQFSDLAQAIDQAMQSTNQDMQASGIWLLCKHIKRNPHFNAFKNAHAVAKIGMASSHRGMRCHTAALLSRLIQKEPRFSELLEIRRFAIEEVHIAITNDVRKNAATFTNSVSLLSTLVDRGIDFEKQEYATIQQAALLGVGHTNAKAWANSLNMLLRLIERQMSTISTDKLTSIALQATGSDNPRVLSGGLQLLRIIVQETKFTQFEAAEQAALRCAEYDNTWVRRRALDVLIELIQKDKLQNCTLAEHIAQRSAHSSNDEEHRAGKHLLDFVVRKKYHHVFLFCFLALAFFGLCYFVGSWLLNRLRNKRLRAMSTFGHKDWREHD